MKLIFLFLLAINIQLSAKSYSQNVTLKGEQLRIPQIFSAIERQTEYVFFYNEEVLKFTTPVTVNLHNVPLTAALNTCLKGQPLHYSIVGHNIIVVSDAPNRNAAATGTQQTSLLIKGTVTDEKETPLTGVTIRIKGTALGTSTDAHGRFQLSVPASSSKILVISFIGTETVEIPVTKDETITVHLKQRTNLQQEVVVTAYGIKRQPKELGYAATTITGKELNQAENINATSGLIGKVSGLSIQTQDNNLNPSYKINLRGNRSITGNNSAIVVLDGAIVQPYILNNINPNDIESVNVLKGSAAASLYGSNGSNGALVITTKKPAAGKTEINFKTSIQWESISKLPNLQYTYGGWGGESSYVDPVTGQPINVPFENQQFGPKYDGSMVEVGTPKRIFYNDGTYKDTVISTTYSPKKGARTDFFQTGITKQYDLSLSAASQNSSIYVAYQRTNRSDIIPENKLSKNFFKLNGSTKYSILNIDYALAYTNTSTNEIWNRGSLYGQILNSPAHVDLNWFKTGFFSSPDNYYNAWNDNPWWNLYNFRTKSTDNKLVGNVAARLRITDNIEASYRFGYTYSVYNYKNTGNGWKYSDYEQSNPYNIPGGTQASNRKTLLPTTSGGSSFESKITGDLLLTFKKELSKNISSKLLLGHSIMQDRYNQEGFGASTLAFNDFYNVSSYIGQQNASESMAALNQQAAFADLSFGINKYLFVHGSYRFDWTSILAAANRRFSYGSADVAFVLSDALPNLFNNDVVNFAKVRVAYSQTGQVNLSTISTYGAYLTTPSFNVASNYPYNNSVGYSKNTLAPNRNLKDERTTEIEAGIELSFLKNRINFTGTVFRQRTKNQTIPTQVSPTTGFSAMLVNGGETSNFGVESDIKLTLIDNRSTGFRWDIGANFSYINNKVISLPNDGADLSMTNDAYAVVGHAFPALKVTDFARDPATGKVIVDNNGYPTRAAAYKFMGSIFQPYRIGLNTSVSYKNFSLSIVADYRGGGVLFNQIGQLLDWTGASEHSTYGNRERFIFPNSVYDDGSGHYVENNSRQIANVYQFWQAYSTVGTPYVTSNAFWKLREVVLSYSVPAAAFKRLKNIQGVTVSATGRNLLMWRPTENIWTDPEFNLGGAYNADGTTNTSQTPPTRFIGGSISVRF
ncbi:SusC/RagA family TonB-linked outer membrane protein [Chitinophaga nivalis]|uniref:SusC/RagA family TonB-linked outer membrane protein n=1 Tax=Chitinophaga nivalis TaxID=2991709 RepID=A0ABT3ISB3_9BACT|nr:SusC/RagA family TonB-linked outer membrane protein [Chitinophaga nivalis]MCW3463471.1 SusC/RagA family TonB-linked outer membrane protein [Chitinophaga nivalis]MCW3486839.1 SusC/RagA family TonB-linked outer membrane protein [Chitinophaga nivalis]